MKRAACEKYDAKRLAEFYNHDDRFGLSLDIEASQYGTRDGRITDPLIYYFLHGKLLKMVSLNIPDGASLLDLGCGPGILAETVRERVKRYVGADISIERIKQSRRRIDSKNSFFVVADAAFLPFKDSAFDAVASIEVIEHLPDTERFLKEVHRALADGGTFILTTPSNLIFEDNTDLLYKDQHLYGFTPRGLKSMLISGSFRVKSIEGIGFKLPKIKIPVWLGSDIIKYAYSKIRGVKLKTGYGSPITLQFDIITNSFFRKIYTCVKWKRPLWVIMETAGFIGRHLPGLASNMVVVCKK